jgi:hypothetical protein
VIFASVQTAEKKNGDHVVLALQLHLTGKDIDVLYKLAGYDVTIPKALVRESEKMPEWVEPEIAALSDEFLTSLRQKLHDAGVRYDNIVTE